MRPAWRRLAFGLATVLGLRRRGFFIPYRYADGVALPGTNPPYPAIEALFAAAGPAFDAGLGAIDRHADALHAIGGQAPPEPRWDQSWFPPLDAAIAYALIRDRRPARIVEIGSGHSTRFLARAVRDGGLKTRIRAIDPEPRADIAGLAPAVEIRRQTIQQAGRDAASDLAAGDVLFIDSSHVAMPGTDVDLLLNHVVPGLPVGVLIHVHDIYLPDDYPPAWGWRGYNEQLVVAALLAGGRFRPVFASRWVATRMATQVAAGVVGRLPQADGAVASSLWLETT